MSKFIPINPSNGLVEAFCSQCTHKVAFNYFGEGQVVICVNCGHLDKFVFGQLKRLTSEEVKQVQAQGYWPIVKKHIDECRERLEKLYWG